MSHKPTFNPAVATKSSYSGSSGQLSAKDLNAHTKLKYRQVGQHSQEEMRQQNLRAELNRREAALREEQVQAIAMVEREEKEISVPLLLTNSAHIDIQSVSAVEDRDADFGESDDDSDDFSDDSDDDEEELQRELERIKNERREALAKKVEEERQLQEASQMNSALRGNPLMQFDSEAGGSIKRRWNDDVVFRNQAVSEPEYKKRFINDTVRNDFHRSFLKKYVM